MSGASLRAMCAAAVLFGLVIELLPEGGGKKIASLCASVSLAMMLFGAAGAAKWDGYALSLAEYRAAAAAMRSDAEAQGDRLNRLVIERECEEYIMDKAAELRIELRSADVSAAWSREGVWVPESAVLVAGSESEGLSELSALIESQLGIAAERQEWRIEGDT